MEKNTENPLGWGLREQRTLSAKKCRGKVTNFFPDEKFLRHFIIRPKLLPDFFIPDRNFYPDYYTSTKIKSKFLHPELQKLVI